MADDCLGLCKILGSVTDSEKPNQTKTGSRKRSVCVGGAGDGGVLGMSAASCPWVSGSTHFHKITNAGSSSSCHLPTGLNVKFQGLNFIPYACEQACQVAGQLIYFCKVQKCFFFIGEQWIHLLHLFSPHPWWEKNHLIFRNKLCHCKCYFCLFFKGL